MAEYISLQEAARLCSYSQEYLSLRARQGKLKALKLGRNWVCTKEWLEDYIAKSENYKKRESRARTVEPPRNLPVYAPDAEIWEDGIPEEVERQKAFQYRFQGLIAVAIVLALFCGSVFQGRQEVSRVGERSSSTVVSIAVSLQNEMRVKGFALGSKVQTWQAASVGEIAKDYFAWLGDQIRNLIKGF